MLSACRAPFDSPRLATANTGGVTLYQHGDSNLNLITGLNQKGISLSLDWTLQRCVTIINGVVIIVSCILGTLLLVIH